MSSPLKTSRLLALCATTGLAWVVGIAGDAAAGSEALVDPTRPDRVAASKQRPAEQKRKSLSLRAIFVSEGRRVAVINGTRVRPGDRIGNAEILAIETTHVRLRAGGRPFVLDLIETPIHRKAVVER